jgi:hypothetical protein
MILFAGHQTDAQRLRGHLRQLGAKDCFDFGARSWGRLFRRNRRQT